MKNVPQPTHAFIIFYRVIGGKKLRYAVWPSAMLEPRSVLKQVRFLREHGCETRIKKVAIDPVADLKLESTKC